MSYLPFDMLFPIVTFATTVDTLNPGIDIIEQSPDLPMHLVFFPTWTWFRVRYCVYINPLVERPYPGLGHDYSSRTAKLSISAAIHTAAS